MTTRRKTLSSLLAALLVSGLFKVKSAMASTIDASAKQDFNAGKWRQAADEASRLHDGDNLAFAARSLLAGALLSSPSRARTADIAAARRYAEAALIIEPKHIEGRLQLATALGLQARSGSPTLAFTTGLPQRVRRVLDGVIRDAPSEPWAYALLGGWHLEGSRIGGSAARVMLGVDVAAGKEAFAKAMRLDSSIAATPFYYAASLLALNPAGNSAEARALLQKAQGTPTRDAFQAEVKARATTLTKTLDAKGPASAARLAMAWL
jgi:hypothetical protein